MLWHGLDLFAANGKMDDDFVSMVDSVADLVPTQSAGRFVSSENIVADLNQADRPLI